MAWTRTCQSCGHKQISAKPDLADKAEKWRNLKCSRCRSEDLDFGSDPSEITEDWKR